MDGLRGELEGTLARTAQKKQTTLNRYTRYLKEQEKVKKYGFATRPPSTSQVSDVKAAIYYYREVRAEFSDKMARMNRQMSIDTHGTAEVRVANEDLNALRREMGRWSDRVVALGGEPQESVASSRARNAFVFYGAAKQLPEAMEASAKSESVGEKRNRSDDEEYFEEEDVADDDSETEPVALSALPSTASSTVTKLVTLRLMPPVSFLLEDVAEERALRKEEAIATLKASDVLFNPTRPSVAGYVLPNQQSAAAIPSDASVWEGVLARRKAALRARIMNKS